MRVVLLYDEVLSKSQRALVRAAQLAELLRRCGDELSVPARADLALRLTDDAALTQLNNDFAGISKPTDVLAFPGDVDHVGDIAISVERACSQASQQGKPEADELRLLAVHGLLHCLGHDHADPESARLMTDATRVLLPGQDVPELVAH